MFSNNSWAPQNVGPRAIARFAPPLSRPWSYSSIDMDLGFTMSTYGLKLIYIL